MPRQRHPGVDPERTTGRPGEQQPAGDPGHRPSDGPADVGQRRTPRLEPPPVGAAPGSQPRPPAPRDATRACAEATRAARTPAAYRPRATATAPSTSQSARHTSHQAVVPGSGGAGKPVICSVGVGSGKSSGTGGALRERAVAMPKAAPMSATSTTARRRNGRARQPGVEVGDRRAPVPPPRRAEGDEEHDLGDDEQPVGRAEVGPAGEPRGRGDHSRGARPRRRTRAPASSSGGHDREPAGERAVQRDEDDEAADPHRGPDEVQSHRVDRRLVVVGRAGVAGQPEHEDARRRRGRPSHAAAPRLRASAAPLVTTRAQAALISPIRVASICQTRSASCGPERAAASAAGRPRRRRSAPPRRRLRRSRRDRRASPAAAPDRSPTAPRPVPGRRPQHRRRGCRGGRAGVGDDRGREDERAERHGGGHVVHRPGRAAPPTARGGRSPRRRRAAPSRPSTTPQRRTRRDR